MSKEFSELIHGGPKPAMGVIEAVKEGIQAIAPGLSLSKILSDIGTELKEQGSQGAHELAAALFRNNDAFVMYPKNGNEQDQAQSVEQTQQKESEGREM
jgi:hypothetical protein